MKTLLFIAFILNVAWILPEVGIIIILFNKIIAAFPVT